MASSYHIGDTKRLHLLFDDRYKGFKATWKDCNSFLIQEGPSDGVVLLYNEASYSPKAVVKFLSSQGRTISIGCGSVDWDGKYWTFAEPSEKVLCEKLITRLVNDDQKMLRYYGDFTLRTKAEVFLLISSYLLR